MKTRIIAIGGGKGGTGKSALLVQAGILLAEQGHRVILVDADLSGPNLHTFFGLEDPDAHLDSVLLGRQELPSSILPTGIHNLAMLPGVQRDLPATFSNEQFARWFWQLRQLEADWILVDVGSGATPWSLQLFESADLGVLVIHPEPTSIEKEYRFLRGVCRYRLQPESEGEPIPSSNWLPVPWLAGIRRKNKPLALRLQGFLRKTPIGIVANQVRTPEDRELAEDMASVCRRFFGLRCRSLGSLPHDDRFWLSIRDRRPAILEYPDSRLSEAIQDMVNRWPHFWEEESAP